MPRGAQNHHATSDNYPGIEHRGVDPGLVALGDELGQ